MYKIVVTGDVIRDHHLLQQPKEDKFNRDHLGKIRQVSAPGGAWYLRKMIELSCRDKGPYEEKGRRGVEILGAVGSEDIPADETACVNRSYSVWSRQCEKSPEKGKCKKEIWRTSSFLGYEAPVDDTRPLRIQKDLPDPSLLVIDDMGMGFRDCKDLWPAALQEGGNPDKIVLKTYPPLADNELWRRLVSEFPDRLTVVVDVAALRVRQAVISEALSWDSTVEQLVKEFREGASLKDLADCRRVIVHFPYSAAAIFTRCKLKADDKGRHVPDEAAPLEGFAQLEQFIYHPEEMEGAWVRERPGSTYGTSSIMTAAVARHLLDPNDYPLCDALKRALAAQKVNHEIGGGDHPERLNVDAANERIGSIFHPGGGGGAGGAHTSEYYEVYPATLIGQPERHKPHTRASLLYDLAGAAYLYKSTGERYEYALKTATDVVKRGWEKALKTAPRARYGDYVTVDREEIERINAIRSLIISYQNNPDDIRPLSIAVFGPPGSGKSFAIKQLAAELFKGQKSNLEFNLSQFKDTDHTDLHTAFQRVRDASVQRQIPLVFWDEFDTGGLRWLKDFLEPTQDARFQSSGQTYSFGQAIFIFAGGTCDDFESFNKTNHPREKERASFRNVKGPDFVSRLRGYVNIKGPNPVLPADYKKRKSTKGDAKSGAAEGAAGHDVPEGAHAGAVYDIVHVIRRAVLLRSTLSRYYPKLIDGAESAEIDDAVINGFLRCEKFLHGARSLEAIVNMSALGRANRYGVAQLPTLDLLRLHVSEDFLEHVLKAPAVPALHATSDQAPAAGSRRP